VRRPWKAVNVSHAIAKREAEMEIDTGGLERLEGPHSEAIKYLRDDMRDFYDHELKNANYLLVAHGAGLIGCLSTLKDYEVAAQLKGIGVFIAMFAVGLLLAAMGTMALSIGRSGMLTWVAHGGEKPKLETGSFWPMLMSLALLIIALLLIAYRFYRL
jgi:hypothetical protein